MTVKVSLDLDDSAYQAKLKRLKNTNASLLPVFGGLSAATAALGGSLVYSTKKLFDFDLGLRKVEKTTGDWSTPDDLKKIEKGVQLIAEASGTSIEDLFGIAEAAGQMGVVGANNIIRFTDAVNKLNVATDLTGADGAKSLIRILTISREGVKDISRLSSAVVALGNNYAATESEIVYLQTRISQSTSEFQIASKWTAGLSAGMKQLGINAELGGTAIGRTIRALKKSVDEGGVSFLKLQNLTGKTADELIRIAEERPDQLFELFAEALGEAGNRGESMTRVLTDFNIRGERMNAVLPALAKNWDVVSGAINLSSKAWEENTALAEEADLFFGSFWKQLEQIGRVLVNAAKGMSLHFAPALSKGLTFAKALALVFKDLASSKLFTTFVVGATAVLGLGAAMSGAVIAINLMKIAIAGLGVTAKIAVGSTGIGLLLVAIGTIALNWEETTRIVKKISKGFLDYMFQSFGALGSLLVGVFTLDTEKIKEGLEQFKQMFSNIVDEVSSKATDLDSLLGEDEEEKEEAPEVEDDPITEREKGLAEARKEINDEEDKRLADRKKQSYKDEVKHGKAVAKIRGFFDSKAVEQAETISNSLHTIFASGAIKNKKLEKAFGISSAIISTAKGVAKALGDVPFPSNLFAAAAVAAQGYAQVATISKAQTGGLVSQQAGTPATGDHQPFLLEPGELILPKNIVGEVAQATSKINQGPENQGGQESVMIGIEDDASDFISIKQREKVELGYGVI